MPSFVMQFKNVPKRNYLKFHMQKVEIIKFLIAMVCELEKVGTVCKLCLILVRVFGGISIQCIDKYNYLAIT